MSSYELELRKRIQIQLAKAIGVALIVIGVIVANLMIYGSLKFIDNLEKSILIGLFIGGEISSIRTILKYNSVLKKPEMLRKIQVKEKDERNEIIVLKSCQTTLNIFMILLAITGLVAGFFSEVVLYTVAVVLIGLLILYTAVRVYYNHKY
ncbi:hypothetical protein ACYSNU_01925 [Enterococcus sp. LJL120]